MEIGGDFIMSDPNIKCLDVSFSLLANLKDIEDAKFEEPVVIKDWRRIIFRYGWKEDFEEVPIYELKLDYILCPECDLIINKAEWDCGGARCERCGYLVTQSHIELISLLLEKLLYDLKTGMLKETKET